MLPTGKRKRKPRSTKRRGAQASGPRAIAPQTGAELSEKLDATFLLIDDAKLMPASIFTSEAAKQSYESFLMFAYRRFTAAAYHNQRVVLLIEQQAQELEEFRLRMKPKKLKLQNVMVSGQIQKHANEFAYELSAFFGALRSGVDFLARICATHLQGVEANSVSTLLSLIDKNERGPILLTISSHADWLRWLRDYRDYLVHKLVVNTSSGGKVIWKGSIGASIAFPVIVPDKTPRFEPDTRRSRAMFELSSLFDVSESQLFITHSDGSQSIREDNISLDPPAGYAQIAKLMSREIANFRNFFAAVLDAVIELELGFDLRSAKRVGKLSPSIA